ncbi:outer membrane protein assembly factor BamC [Paenalcaligenes niemegkensis]|uniref:outer membrane protein assembly factor BamC n=1 Tax=Paenalcaligenes niemegkensis TaxID=2895469 RepID=UPI001EE8696A|nr:outer membrane protein assembly factor BamC [Paenalcaligenes niemegkensis]MCQ9615782.1 outer membrane protein assembly factor BamC [Paenalcaligenes niemegkensis]
MRITRINKIGAMVALGMGATLMAGCSTINKITGGEESVDYKSTVRGEPLSIPPDLTQANADVHYRAPEGVTSYTDYAQAQQAQQGASREPGILPPQEGIEVKRDGQLRWLEINRSAEEVYPSVVEFWSQQGFTLQSQDPRAGVVQTDWAENRAKIPEGWIRSALGSIIDQVFDSGERERFTTRLERINGRTEVYISHQHMEETPTTDGAAFKWVYGKEDPGLNAAMLARLMVFLGTDVNTAQAQVAEAEKASPDTLIETVTQDGLAELNINESFDRAWRRVGVAIDAAGFSVEDRDRSTGDYYVRYLDSDTGEKIEQQNIIGRLFGGRNTAEAARYRIRVNTQGSASTVTVLDENGQVQNTDTAKRILNVLSNHMGQ